MNKTKKYIIIGVVLSLCTFGGYSYLNSESYLKEKAMSFCDKRNDPIGCKCLLTHAAGYFNEKEYKETLKYAIKNDEARILRHFRNLSYRDGIFLRTEVDSCVNAKKGE